MLTTYTEFEHWKNDASYRGWIHVHDDCAVCDDGETGECIGEWCDITQTGWMISHEDLA